MRLVVEEGKSAAQVCRDLDLTHSVLCSWVRQAKIDAGKGPAGALTSAEKEELTQLRKENRELLRPMIDKETGKVLLDPETRRPRDYIDPDDYTQVFELGSDPADRQKRRQLVIKADVHAGFPTLHAFRVLVVIIERAHARCTSLSLHLRSMFLMPRRSSSLNPAGSGGLVMLKGGLPPS